MDLKKYYYFVNVIENNFNLSKTAKKLNVSQATISVAVIDLEKHFKIELIKKKDGRYYELTLAGKKFYNDAKKLIVDYERLNYELSNSDSVKGSIKIGISEYNMDYLSLYVIPQLIIQNRIIDYQLCVDNQYQLLEMLSRNEIDLAIVNEPVMERYLILKPIEETRLVLVCNNTCEMSKSKNFSFNNLDDSKLLMLSLDCLFNQYISSIYSKYLIDYNVAVYTYNINCLLEIINNEKTYTILPYNLIKDNYKKYKNIRICEIYPNLNTNLSIAYHQDKIKTAAFNATVKKIQELI